MPHSGGGGSSHGGSHHSSSSSHSHGGSGGSSTRHVSKSYFPGSHVYVRYANGMPEYRYSSSPTELKPMSISDCALVLIPAVIMFVICIFMAVRFSLPLSLAGVSDTEPVIEDPYGYLGNTDDLLDTMYEIRNKTGMVPVVISVDNNDWKPYGYSLMSYAYNLYVSMYDDEKHIMIVYSYGSDGSWFGNWYWESMYGDDTDNILYPAKCDKFADDLTDNLLKYDTPAEAINATWREYLPHFIGIYIQWGMFAPAIVFGVFFGFIFIILVISDKTRMKQFAGYQLVERPVVENNVPKTDNCEYCGGLYVISSHLSCPHCGAPLPAHDNTGKRIN